MKFEITLEEFKSHIVRKDIELAVKIGGDSIELKSGKLFNCSIKERGILEITQIQESNFNGVPVYIIYCDKTQAGDFGGDPFRMLAGGGFSKIPMVMDLKSFLNYIYNYTETIAGN